MKTKTRILAVIVATAIPLAAGCGSSGSERAESADTTVGASGTSSSDTTMAGATTEVPATSAPADDGTDLDGVWHADAGEILAQKLASFGGGVATISCTGQITLEFVAAEGKLTNHSDDITCSSPDSPITVTAVADSRANYTVSGNEVTVTDAVSEGHVTIAGSGDMPFSQISDGTFTYSISGDTLTKNYTNGLTGATVTETWQRGS